MKPLENMVEEKGIEPSTFALRMLPQRQITTESNAYEAKEMPKTVISGSVIAQTGHTLVCPAAFPDSVLRPSGVQLLQDNKTAKEGAL